MNTANRTHPALWKKVVAEVRASDKGGLPGQWSARKAQLAVALYKARGGGYRGPKSANNALTLWTKQRWRTRSGKPSLETGERYLPEAAIQALTPQEYAATTKAKRQGMRQGKQFVPQPPKVRAKTKAYRNPTFFHGTSRWEGPAEIREQRAGHAEYGTGIYGTTEWNTATKYGRSVYVIQTPALRYLEDASLPLADTLAWLAGQKLKAKREIAEALTRRATNGYFPAEYLVNRIVNEGQSHGKVGLALTKYLVAQGIEASRIHRSGEDWIVIFDPRVIQSVQKADTKAPGFAFTLPRLAQQNPARGRLRGGKRPPRR